MFDSSGGGKDMRRWCFLTLGIWHPYKKACEVIWRRWVQRYFGRLFHEIIPASNVYGNPRLRNMVTFMSYCRLAYPQFKAQLKEAIIKAKTNKQHTDIKWHLRDLRNLMEFFIPVVSHFSSCVFVILILLCGQIVF
jgi:hypothetical protein